MRAFLLNPCVKLIRGNKMRTLASKSLRIQKTLEKIVIDNNSLATEVIFINSFQSYIRVKTLKFYTYCYEEIDEI